MGRIEHSRMSVVSISTVFFRASLLNLSDLLATKTCQLEQKKHYPSAANFHSECVGQAT